MRNKILSLLGMARRANKLALGFEAAVQSIQNGKCAVTVVSEDISEKTQKELRFHAGKQGTNILTVPVSLTEMGNAVGQKTGIIAVNDPGFARALTKLYETPAADMKEDT